MSNVFEDIAQAFPPVGLEEWKKGVAKALKGEPFEKRLVVRTLEGLHLQPLYTREDAVHAGSTADKGALAPGDWPFTRGFPSSRAVSEGPNAEGGSPWAIASRVAHASLDAVHTLALEDLEGGVQTLEIPIVRARTALAEGLAPAADGPLWLESDDDLAQSLQGVHRDLAPVALCPRLGTDPEAAVSWALALRNALETKQGALASARGRPSGLFVQCDLVAAATHGAARFEALVGLLSNGARPPSAAVPGDASPLSEGSPLDARPFLLSAADLHGAGGNVVQEMALLLGAFVALLRATDARGLDRAWVLRATEFRVAVASDFFTEVSKLRALRTCLGKVFDAVGLTPFAEHALLSAVTSEFTCTRYDSHVNLLRSTEQTFAAVLGGATKILTLPFDLRVVGSTRFGHRLARNVQIILAEEAGAGRVADAAGGSWYVERRTEDLGEAAWTLFREWESKGGVVTLLEGGQIQTQVEAVWEARKKGLHRRREGVLGVSEFPLKEETPPRPDVPFDADALRIRWEKRLGVASASNAPLPLPAGVPFPRRFLAESFERLRDASTELKAATGRPPAVFVAVHGAPASWWNRLGWVKNLFATAGVDTLLGDASRTLTENVELYRKSGATTVILVSTDDLYAVCVPEFTSAFKAAGAREVWVAGNPGEKESAWRASGVDAFAFVGCDAHALLRSLLQSFGGPTR